ncbi:hypothetical protein BV22DRAFT_1044296 [Leucogyrophana mollusca]|uniref:Uncharacterized protein n=1 Tax=Leucogyrophana mollusca TaxID=85980 RepID=A0ACB8BVQ9_9AGAM|nr:hypothetical protein BV22DRAFT_1044296 [Leucogyrophana mollusca]
MTTSSAEGLSPPLPATQAAAPATGPIQSAPAPFLVEISSKYTLCFSPKPTDATQDIKARDLPEKYGLRRGKFYAQLKIADKTCETPYFKLPKPSRSSERTSGSVNGSPKPASNRSLNGVAEWDQPLNFEVSDSSTFNVKIYARRWLFGYKSIRRTKRDSTIKIVDFFGEGQNSKDITISLFGCGVGIEYDQSMKFHIVKKVSAPAGSP